MCVEGAVGLRGLVVIGVWVLRRTYRSMDRVVGAGSGGAASFVMRVGEEAQRAT